MGIRWFPFFDTTQIKIPRLHFGKKVRGRLDPKTVLFDGSFGDMSDFVSDPLTRRQIVSKRASIFDMFGKISPVMAKLKRFEREVIHSTDSWDAPIPDHLRLKAIQNFIMIEKLRGIHYTRAKIPVDAVNVFARIILVVDAAEDVLMFTVYIGFKRDDGSWSCDHLIGRSALCSLTIPRNEMQAMMSGSNLAWLVRKDLSENVEEQLTCGDSEIVLHWILSDHRRLESWHRNRVVQIRRAIDLDKLYHVSSKDNPADIGTRPDAITEADVVPGSRYLKGDFWMTLDTCEAVSKGFITPAAGLKLSPEKTKDYSEGLVLEPDIPEVIVKGHTSVRVPELTVFTAARREMIAERADFAKYDPDLLPTKRSFPRMLRVSTLVMTFLAKLMKRIGKSFSGPLLSPCDVKLQVMVADGTNHSGSERLPEFGYKSMVVFASFKLTTGSVQALSSLASQPAGGKVCERQLIFSSDGVNFLQTQAVFENSHTEVHVQLALQYYFRLATREVKEFNSKSMIDKIAVEVDGLLLSRSTIHDVLNFIETGDL